MNKQLFSALSCSATVFCWVSTAGASVEIDGDALYGLCTDEYRVADAGECLGYVMGIENVMAHGDAVNHLKACPAVAVDEQQLLRIVKDYLHDDGDQGGEPASTLVASALAGAFPCRR